MKIRSITYFFNPGWPLDENKLRQAEDFIAAARPAFQEAGYEVQTVRMATIPFPKMLPSLKGEEAIQLAQAMDRAVEETGYDYASIGPALPDVPASYSLIPSILAKTQKVFLAAQMTLPEGGVSLSSVRACAGVIHGAARLTPDGFANLRFAALANVPPLTPFFPAAYHDSDRSTFAIATQAADLAVEAFSQASDLEDAHQRLVQMIEQHAHQLDSIAERFFWQFNLPFSGIDFTLAPFPEEASSLGTAIERLGVSAVGLHGSLAAAAIMADSLSCAHFRHTGFNGLMMPVLEDATLARRAAEGLLTVKDLLLYSTVCGTGLDTLPLPGDTSIEQLYAILLDLATLAQRLDKPLTARLMPIPSKQAGDLTGFDFAYFANSRVLRLDAEALSGPMNGNGSIYFVSRRAHKTQN
jgi:uncharacterized protein (UPF0210 family)